ncbi:hypothetical protein G7K_4729-t1 [Saitoella complicata NRRL Y-17804]|uniref:Uncharacterized protein n=1 Tax=Saitoella complicata (strain BCRC 22490 / CBS 7301 / JCM 7358 / NBRC 10748 / NRRL Y-17804) TaxID=698492 RepID=A0A0E9NMF6_SAICN|nr:hypothetical protein G7K_4729-t1 [Saitoella complicata NRRL Y-17804]
MGCVCGTCFLPYAYDVCFSASYTCYLIIFVHITYRIMSQSSCSSCYLNMPMYIFLHVYRTTPGLLQSQA